jgi:hypothetical protein
MAGAPARWDPTEDDPPGSRWPGLAR